MLVSHLFRRIGRRPAPEDQQPPLVHSNGQDLEAFGQAGETIRDKIALYRLKVLELQSLQDDFEAVSSPIETFVSQHLRAQSDLVEMKSRQAQARLEYDAVASENKDLRSASLQRQKDVETLTLVKRQQEQTIAQVEGELQHLRRETADLRVKGDELQAALGKERESGGALANKIGRLVADLTDRDARNLSLEAQIAELDDRLALEANESLRLRELVEDATASLASSKRSVGELRAELRNAHAGYVDLETQLASERDARAATVHRHEAERYGFEAERAKLYAENEALLGKANSLSSLLEQARASDAAKAEAIVAAERTRQQLSDDLQQLESRYRSVDRDLGAAKQSAGEFADKNKALMFSKDDLERKLDARETSIRELTNVNEQRFAELQRLEGELAREIAEREAAYRKLREDFEKERAERTLAQGALTIARASREKLSEHLDVLRQRRAGLAPQVAVLADEPRPMASNVHNLRGNFEANDQS